VVAWLAGILAYLMGRLLRRSTSGAASVRLLIESGVRGWELIEYRELLRSAEEYLGPDSCSRLVVTSGRGYVSQFRDALRSSSASGRVTHALLSPRTGHPGVFRGVLESIAEAFLITRADVVPVVVVSDVHERLQRAKAFCITARRGAVVMMADPRVIRRHLPHRRVLGPQPMALSRATLEWLDSARPRLWEQREGITFCGTMYEPRASRLRALALELERDGRELAIKGRTSPRESRLPDRDYWNVLLASRVVVTTTGPVAAADLDWPWLHQLVYRYLEATACGALLVAEPLPGGERYFTAGVHFIEFTEPEGTARRIAEALEEPSVGRSIAERGYLRARALIEEAHYWRSIDTFLGPDGLT